MVSIIVAMTKDHVIGKNNKLIWHISEDLKNFKKLTMGNTVIMGRKTFESILAFLGKPLPNRNNIILSRNLKRNDVMICSSLKDAIEKGKEFNKEIFIIGGASVYEQALPYTNKMYISYVKNEYNGDAFFPNFNENEWIIEKEEEKEEFTFKIYIKK